MRGWLKRRRRRRELKRRPQRCWYFDPADVGYTTDDDTTATW